MAAKRRRYTGELATPIVWRDPPTFEGAVTPARVKEFWRNYERHQREAEQRIAEKLLQKMTLLMKHYRIVDENLAALAWALASQHVPGFKILPETKIKKGGSGNGMALASKIFCTLFIQSRSSTASPTDRHWPSL
jgi:hypothetical protein